MTFCHATRVPGNSCNTNNGIYGVGLPLLTSVFLKEKGRLGFFVIYGRQFTYFLGVNNTEYADAAYNVVWKDACM